MKHLDLFSGIGGFALAASWLGIKTIGFCDNDPWCRRVLDKHWPEVPKHADIRTLTGDIVEQWGGADLITGGFPCQSFSVAGKRRGTADDHHLWPEMARLVDELRPTYVLGENVPGIISLALEDVCADLESIGYAVRPVVVPAIAVDAPHKRERVWIMASRNAPVADCNNGHECEDFALRAGWDAADDGGEPISDANNSRQLESQRRVSDERGRLSHGAWWPAEPGVLRVAHGLPGAVDRVRGLANAIVPQVAYEILRIMTTEESL